MKQAYKDINFRSATRDLIYYLDNMIVDYQNQGYVLSVRQLYYQLVARGKIPNTEKSYKHIAGVINNARLAGMLDWDAIEDRGRDIVTRNRWTNGASVIRASAQQFHMDMWANQRSRVFIIVEKAALAGVLQGVCTTYDVPLLAAKGYPSVSIVRELVEDHLLRPAINGQEITILHLGDHDPSGLDMTRDLDERIAMFAEDYANDITVKRIALTMDQVDEETPPPNPAKVTDSRFIDYQKQYGDESWELDALTPAYLTNLITVEIADLIEQDLWDERKEEIEAIRAELIKVSVAFDKKGI